MPRLNVKDTNERLDYSFDWSAWLAYSQDDVISAATVTPSGGIVLENVEFTDTLVTFWFPETSPESTPPGAVFTVECYITTVQGRTANRTMTIRLIDR